MAIPFTTNDNNVKPKYVIGFKVDGEVVLFYFNNMNAYNVLQRYFDMTSNKSN